VLASLVVQLIVALVWVIELTAGGTVIVGAIVYKAIVYEKAPDQFYKESLNFT